MARLSLFLKVFCVAVIIDQFMGDEDVDVCHPMGVKPKYSKLGAIVVQRRWGSEGVDWYQTLPGQWWGISQPNDRHSECFQMETLAGQQLDMGLGDSKLAVFGGETSVGEVRVELLG